MMEIKSFSNCSEPDYKAVLDLWNNEVGFIYPISKKVFDQNVTNSQWLLKNGSFVAIINNEVVGFIIGKIFDNPMIPDYSNFGFISLFYVYKKYRKQGIGSRLLDLTEAVFKNLGKKIVHFGRDYNNFFPGIPCDFDNLTSPWLVKRGYNAPRYTHDLINYDIQKQEYEVKKSQFEIRLATHYDYPNLLDFLSNNFPGRWQYEYYDYFKREEKSESYLIALDKNKVIGFCRVNDQNLKVFPYNLTFHQRFINLGGIGPLGIDKKYRKHGLGYDIVAKAIMVLKSRNYQQVIIDWTSLLDFYQKFEFEVWKNYLYCYKVL